MNLDQAAEQLETQLGGLGYQVVSPPASFEALRDSRHLVLDVSGFDVELGALDGSYRFIVEWTATIVVPTGGQRGWSSGRVVLNALQPIVTGLTREGEQEELRVVGGEVFQPEEGDTEVRVGLRIRLVFRS